MKRRRPEQILLSHRLPPTLAARVAGLPEADQTALARLVQEIGESGFVRIINAFAPGGRRAGYGELEPLLRQMAAEMMARNPHLHGIGANWRKGENTAANKVVESPAGWEFREACGSIEPDSLRKRLVRAWKEHGRRLLQEHVAAQNTAWLAHPTVKAWQELGKEGSEFRVLMDKFSDLNALMDKFCPRYIRSK
jgi:hypothetical protein